MNMPEFQVIVSFFAVAINCESDNNNSINKNNNDNSDSHRRGATLRYAEMTKRFRSTLIHILRCRPTFHKSLGPRIGQSTHCHYLFFFVFRGLSRTSLATLCHGLDRCEPLFPHRLSSSIFPKLNLLCLIRCISTRFPI